MSASVASCPGLSDDEADRYLTGFVVGDADHRSVGHRRVGEQERLELGRWDLEALVLDELLEPVDDEEVSLVVDVADVAGVEPSVVVDGVRGRGRVVQVARHHLRTAHPDLAVQIDADRLAVLRVDDAASRCSAR